MLESYVKWRTNIDRLYQFEFYEIIAWNEAFSMKKRYIDTIEHHIKT